MSLSLFNSGPLLDKSLKAILIKWGRWPLLLWAIVATFKDSRSIIKATGVLLFSATLVVLSSLTQKFLGFEFLRWRSSSGYFATPSGPFKNQNALAGYLICIVPVFLGLSLRRWSKTIFTVFFIGMTFVTMAVIFWTNTRGAWLGVILGLSFIILIIGGRGMHKAFVVLLPVSLFFYTISIIAFISLYSGKLDSNRFTLFRGAWKMITENPFLGKGIGTFMDYSPSYINNLGACYAHNCYLQMWAESGIFSLLSFFLFTGYVFYKSIKAGLKAEGTLDFFILIGLTAGLMGFLVHSFFEVHLYSFQLSFLFWVMLGLTVALSSRLNQSKLLNP
jgi:O-antigen ligase